METEKYAFASRLLETGEYSDLKVICGAKTYDLHKAFVCAQSGFFAGGARFAASGFTSRPGELDLTGDDPEAVEHMINFLYKQDYLQKSSSVDAAPRRPKIKLDRSQFEDPLLATAMGCGMLNAKEIKRPDTPVEDDKMVSTTEDEEIDDEAWQLVVHARVYALADKCLIPSLKHLAAQKFIDQIAQHYDSPAFAMACEEVYESTLDSDRGLRDPILDLLIQNPAVAARDDVKEVMDYTPTMRAELGRVRAGLPAYENK